MYMIGQVAALRDEVTTIAELHQRCLRAAAPSCSRALRARRTIEPEPPRRPPRTSRSSGSAASSPARPTWTTFWANILDKVDAIGEVPAERWDWRRMYDPDPSRARTRSTRAGAGSSIRCRSTRSRSGCRRSRWRRSSRSSCSRCSAPRPRCDDAGYAARPFDRERTSVILGAGGGGADIVGRLHGPLGAAVAARRRPPELQRAAVRAPARVDRGQLRRPADERRRRAASPTGSTSAGRTTRSTRPAPRRSARSASAARELQVGHQRHGAGRRRRRDPEPVRLPVLRQDPGAVARRAAAGRSTPAPTGSPSARGSRRSCSSASPTPSATATASTP